jgi:recombination DNA repair RAD52 pathway protein
MDMEQSTLAPLTPRQLEALHARLNPDRVQQRSGMSYLEAWDVKASLIKVFGYGGFSAECVNAQIIREEQVAQTGNSDRTNWAVSAQATVRLTIPQLGVVYTESAIATNKQPDWGEAADTALKSAESDALKRAAIYLGTQFGLSLYKNGSTDNIINTVLAPGQQEIVADINVARAQTPEAEAAKARLQARMKVHSPTVTEVDATVSEPTVTTVDHAVTRPTVTEPPAPAPVPVATVTAPVAKALENAERVAAELDQAETAPAPAKRARRTSAKAKPAAVSADKLAIARQALATAEQNAYGDDSARGRAYGTTPPVRNDDDPYLLNYGPGSPDFVMDDEIQAREDAR